MDAKPAVLCASEWSSSSFLPHAGGAASDTPQRAGGAPAFAPGRGGAPPFARARRHGEHRPCLMAMPPSDGGEGPVGADHRTTAALARGWQGQEGWDACLFNRGRSSEKDGEGDRGRTRAFATTVQRRERDRGDTGGEVFRSPKERLRGAMS